MPCPTYAWVSARVGKAESLARVRKDQLEKIAIRKD